MRHLIRIVTLLGIGLMTLIATKPVQAFPPLPSSFYGTVKVNGKNVQDGTPIKAIINGKVYAEGQTQTYKGDSVYSLDIPGDDASTTDVIEGGHDGDKVAFNVNGVDFGQTGVWKSGTNINLDLSASMSAIQNAPTSPVGSPSQATTLTTHNISSQIDPKNDPAESSTPTVVIGIVAGFAALGIILWLIFVHK